MTHRQLRNPCGNDGASHEHAMSVAVRRSGVMASIHVLIAQSTIMVRYLEHYLPFRTAASYANKSFRMV